jgi:hypothetical protein
MIKNSYLKLVFALLTLVSISAHAQGEGRSMEDGVKMTIQNLFDGMRKSDTALIRFAFAPNAIMQTITKNKEGKVFVRSEMVDSFLVSIARPHTEVYDERISFDVVKIDAELAIAWTPYKFYVGEKFSHCGVNSFQLVNQNGTWKIQYIIDTRRRQGCEQK